MQVDPAAGTSGLLLAGLERLMDPLLVIPPFFIWDAARHNTVVLSRYASTTRSRFRAAVVHVRAVQAASAAMALVVIRSSSWQMLSTSASENSPSGPVGARSLKGGS